MIAWGLQLDPVLLLDKLVATVARGAFHQLWLVSHLQPYLGRKNLSTAVGVLVTSKLDYLNALYMRLLLMTVWMLPLVQNAVSRILT